MKLRKRLKLLGISICGTWDWKIDILHSLERSKEMDKKNLLKSKREINGYEVVYAMIMVNKVCKDDPRCDLRTYSELVLTALFDPEICEKVT
jgi:hypothetical protein